MPLLPLPTSNYTSIPAFYYPLLHVITLSNTLTTALSVWVIVVHSPPSMAVYKWFLLNAAVGLPSTVTVYLVCSALLLLPGHLPHTGLAAAHPLPSTRNLLHRAHPPPRQGRRRQPAHNCMPAHS